MSYKSIISECRCNTNDLFKDYVESALLDVVFYELTIS